MNTYEIYTANYSKIIQADCIKEALEYFEADSDEAVVAIFDIKSLVGKSILKKL